ncbi:ABC transporter permease [Neobacillus novalis]|uniref:ABC transporter permease n=1 Tax=Neobacillus novalis TaxID=220687 RepID=A0AA95MNW7_9BACI|nr:ABC transporter permease [Neobacillus novalis]WHY87502.1 ABC transporter permease [Neobacillus novalis]
MVHSWKITVVLLLTPMLFFAGIGLVCIKLFSEEAHVQLFEIAIVDEDQTLETKYVIGQLLDNSHLTKVTKVIIVDYARASKLMKKNKVAAMIVIPDGFSRDVKKGRNTPVKVIGNGKRPLQAQLVRHLMESAAKLTTAAQSGINTIDHFLAEEDVPNNVRNAEFKKSLLSFSLHILGRGTIFEMKEKKSLFQQDILQYYVISFYLLLIIIWSFGFHVLLRGRINAPLRNRLNSRGITEWKEKFAGFAAIVVSVSLISYLLSLPITWWFGSTALNNGILLYIVLIVLTFSAFFMMLAVLVSNDQLFLLLGIGLIIVGSVAGGHFIPAIYFPDWLERIGTFTINSWALRGIFDPTALQSIQMLGLITISCLVFSAVYLKTGNRRCKW